MRLLSRLTPLLLIATLTGCSWFSGLVGPDRDEFAPPCPRPTLIVGLEDLTRFRSEGGKDLTDMVVQGRVLGLGGDCRFTSKGATTVEASVIVSAEFLRGPAMQGRTTSVSLFIAVTEGGVVLDKQVIEFPIEFNANVDRVALQSQPVRMILPSTRTKSPAAFNIVAGFQLTPAELATNKQRTPGR